MSTHINPDNLKVGDKVRLKASEKPRGSLTHDRVLTITEMGRNGAIMGLDGNGYGLWAYRFELAEPTPNFTLGDDTSNPLWTTEQGNAVAECAIESHNEAEKWHEIGTQLAARGADLAREAGRIADECDQVNKAAREAFDVANHLKAREEALDSFWD
jgi:hypothetical protein